MRAALTIGVLGSGAWGTALAQALARGGHLVKVWSIEPAHIKAINDQHQHPHFEDVILASSLIATSDLRDLKGSAFILNAVSAQAVRVVAKAFGEEFGDTPMILCSKGIEQQTHKLMTEVCQEICPSVPVAVLSGPTFADDVMRGRPVAFDLACVDQNLGQDLVKQMDHPGFRGIFTQDIMGVQLGGALKNVMAIACGIGIGLGLGESFRAKLLTQALCEMVTLGRAMGAKEQTFYGLSGLGDLVLTCTGPLSRNLSLGMDLGRGFTFTEALHNRQGAVAEGVYTTQSAIALARKHGIEMPLVLGVDGIINHGASPQAVLASLI